MKEWQTPKGQLQFPRKIGVEIGITMRKLAVNESHFEAGTCDED